MKACDGKEAIVQCYEALEWRGRLWLFIELMTAGSLTPIVEERQGQITEGVISYILR
jgi:serine/threonine protein kinase